jgi:hypothetical protein
MGSGFRVFGQGQVMHNNSKYVAVGLRCAAVVLTAGLVAACSGGGGGHASAAHSSNAPATSATGSKTVQPTVAPPTGQSKAKSSPARPVVASPVVQCGNHLRMGLIMTDPKQPVPTQVVTFSRAVRPAPSWEITAFQNVVTQFSSTVASHGEKAALQQPAFAYPALLRVCTQSAAH